MAVPLGYVNRSVATRNAFTMGSVHLPRCSERTEPPPCFFIFNIKCLIEVYKQNQLVLSPPTKKKLGIVQGVGVPFFLHHAGIFPKMPFSC